MAAGIELVGLTKRFHHGHAAAVDDIDLSVAGGEFFSLLGPSGCGKTTTLRLVAGFEEPTAGRILLDGVDVAGVPPHKRNVNTVFQSYALFPFMSVFDNVAFGLKYARCSKAELKTRVRRDRFIRSFEEDVAVHADGEFVASRDFDRWLNVQIAACHLRPRLAEFLADSASGGLTWGRVREGTLAAPLRNFECGGERL